VNLTPRGRAIAAGAAASLAVGTFTGTTVPALVGLAGALALAYAARAARVPEVTVDRELEAPVVREGVPVRARLTAHTKGTARVHVNDELSPGLEVAEGTNHVDPDQTTATYRLQACVPRHLDVGPAEVTARDPLGLVEHADTRGPATTLTALPRTREVDELTVASMARMLSGDHQTGQRGLGSDFYALREYREGDSIRQVNWKASARTGDDELIVNQRERESQARVTILFDAREVARVGTLGTNAWVLGTRAAASLAEAATQLRDQPRLVLYGPQATETHTPTDGDPLQQGLLEPLLGGTPKGAIGLAEAVDELRADVENGEPVAIVSHLLSDDTIPDAVLTLSAIGANVIVVSPDGAALVDRSGAADAAVEAARQARRSRLDRLRALGTTTVDWAPDEPLHQAVDRALEVAS